MTSCHLLTLFLLLLVLFAPCISSRGVSFSRNFADSGATLIHTEEGVATLFSISKSHENATAVRRLQRRHGRELIGADAKMKLFDDLLNKGYYTGELFIGTPAQKFALIVDTGSTVTYVPCSTCKHCGSHQDTSFDPSHSSSYVAIPCGDECRQQFQARGCEVNSQCKYERMYAEQSSSSGVLGSDLVGFGVQSSLPPQQLVFGCENDEQGDLFRQKADGIMGLGRGPLSIVDQLVEKSAIGSSFSLCYGGMDEVGGAMVLGAMTPPAGMVFANSDPDRSTYYNLPLEGIRVNGEPLSLDPSIFNGKHGTVLDSGTTYCYLPAPAFYGFVESVSQHVSSVLKRVPGPDPEEYPDICFADAGSDVSKLSDFFPKVDFVFGGNSVVSLAPENYLFRHISHRGAYCLGVFKNDKDATTLIGGIVVRNMLVTYDRENKRIGFWRTKCTDLLNQLAGGNVPPPSSDEGRSSGMPPPVPSVAPLGPPPQVLPASSTPIDVDSKSLPGAGENRDLPQVIASLELDISFNMSAAKFATLKSAFIEDMARELEVLPSQVVVLGTSERENYVSVHWAILPAPSTTNLTTSMAEGIVSGLVNHSVRLRDAFGTYQLTSSKWQPLYERSWSPRTFKSTVIVILASLLVVSVAVLGAMALYQRIKSRKTGSYVPVDQMDEKGELEPL